MSVCPSVRSKNVTPNSSHHQQEYSGTGDRIQCIEASIFGSTFQGALAEASERSTVCYTSAPVVSSNQSSFQLIFDQPCHKSMWAIYYFYRAFQAAQADFLTILGPCERETLIKASQKVSGSTGI